MYYYIFYLIIGILTFTYKPIFFHLQDYVNDIIIKEIKSQSKFYQKIIIVLLSLSVLLILIAIYINTYPILFTLRLITMRKEIKNKKQLEMKEKNIKAKFEGITPPYTQIIKAQNQPFNVTTNQIIYFENEFNPFLNKYFSANFEKINAIFKSKENSYETYNFVYIPLIVDNIEKYFPNINQTIFYYYPYLNENDLNNFFKNLNNFQTSFFTKLFLKSTGYEGEIYSGLFRYRGYSEFSYTKLDCSNPNELEKLLRFYSDNIKNIDDNAYYSIVPVKDLKKLCETDSIADFSFNYESHKLVEDVKNKIEQLKSEGYYQLILHAIAQSLNDAETNTNFNSLIPNFDLTNYVQNPKLSKLLINSEYKIFLPDFNSIEIELTPLPKAVFFLFLRHPEGIVFKYLIDYKNELLDIYKQLSYRETLENIHQSIDELVNPTKNSINEKCSRIKEAFVKHFDESIAKFYYITGERGKEKSIKLDRDLIIWEFDETLMPLKTKSKTPKEIEEIEKTQKQKLETGRVLLRNKEFNKAISIFSEIHEVSKFNYKSYMFRAVAYFETGQYIKAIEDNSKAIELNDLADSPFHNRAEAYLMIKEYTKALNDINHYLTKVDNKCPESYYIRGLIKMELNDITGACQDWFNADYLKHSFAKYYLNKYPQIKIKKVLLETKN